MSSLIALTIVIPLFFSALLLLINARSKLYLPVVFLGALLSFLAPCFLLVGVFSQGIQVLQVGGWAAPYGISLVADPLSALMGSVVGLLSLCCILYSSAEIDLKKKKVGYFSAIFTLIVGCQGVLLAGDIFNLYVWIEVLMISSFLLMSSGTDLKQIKVLFAYVILNFFASILILAGVSILFGLSGTLNLADLHVKITGDLPVEGTRVAASALLIGFGIKAALFPMYFWLPDAYPRASIAVSALLAGLYTKVAVCVLIRLFTLVFFDLEELRSLILWVSLLTMLFGVFGALSQYDFRRLLSFHIISQVGYMTLGLALFTTHGISAAIFFIIHNILAKANLFLISGVAKERYGSFNLKRLGGIFKWSPVLSLAFLVSAYSLAGIPPLSGFWAKFAVVRAAFLSDESFAGAICLVVGFLTLASMTKIWLEAFWKPRPGTSTCQTPLSKAKLFAYFIPICTLSFSTFLLGIFPGYLFKGAELAALSLLNPSGYVEAVLGGLQ